MVSWSEGNDFDIKKVKDCGKADAGIGTLDPKYKVIKTTQKPLNKTN